MTAQPGTTDGGPVDRDAGGSDGGSEPEAAARSLCLRALETSPRTRSELAQLLKRKGISPDVADAVLNRYTEVGLIDDTAFAAAWVSSRHTGRGLARRALRHELLRRGVQDETVAEAVSALDPDTELATARALVARRLPATRGLSPEVRVRRLAGLLARKGYPAGTAFAVVRDALSQEGATEVAKDGGDEGLAEGPEDGRPVGRVAVVPVWNV